ncbi:MAG: RNA methyltransferase [Burkholderiaceae bacterium]|nr:RNA methyltransferase [Burkholderiaceae bacterium]
MKRIDSATNPAFRRWLRLMRDPRAVRVEGRALAEGVHLAAELAATRVPVEALLLRRGPHGAEAQRWIETFSAAGTPTYELAPALFDRLSALERGAGIALVFAVPRAQPDAEGDLLLLDGVQDPGNAGALVRVAAAAGVRSVLATSGTTALWAPKALRGGQGAHFRVAIVEGVTVPQAQALPGVRWVAAAAHGAASLWQTDLRAARIGWAVGAEGRGLSREVDALCAQRVSVPLAAGIESLNVVAAAAVCLFERRRQLLAATLGGAALSGR